jgi:hypothetical protein
MSTWWENNSYISVWNTLYQIWMSGILVLEGPTSLSGQLHWVNYTKSFLPLVKKLPIFEYKWVNVKLYSSISCEGEIFNNLLDFCRKVWTPLKLGEIQIWICSRIFNLQSCGILKFIQKVKFHLIFQTIDLQKLENFWTSGRSPFRISKFSWVKIIEIMKWSLTHLSVSPAD